jgi:hypothetical protein
MGGRGAKIGTVARLPNYRRAKIIEAKLKNYLLNPAKSNGKFEFFNALGYNMKNARRLESDIREGLKSNKAVAFATNKYGHSAYQVDMQLGISEKAGVVTAWQIDKGDNIPRFITAYKKRV